MLRSAPSDCWASLGSDFNVLRPRLLRPSLQGKFGSGFAGPKAFEVLGDVVPFCGVSPLRAEALRCETRGRLCRLLVGNGFPDPTGTAVL